MKHWVVNRKAVLPAMALLLFTPLVHKLEAHPAQFTTLHMRLDADGRFDASLNIDMLSFALGQASAKTRDEELRALLDGPRTKLAACLAGAGEHFRHEVIVRTDAGDAAIATWKLPDLAQVDAVLARQLQPRILMPGEIRFAGNLPPNASEVSIRLPYIMDRTVFMVELPGGGSHVESVPAGSYSSNVPIALAANGKWDLWVAIGQYIHVGFRHIIPEGQDHILFVLGLFLFSARLGPLLWQVSAFTLAHSITLGLALYGVVRLPASITEPLIAASIVFVAVENIFARSLQPWRYAVVFCFGLVHGMGFALAFADAGLPRRDFFIGLVGFNLGVECGQLAVLAVAFLAVGWFRQRPWYRKAVVIPTSTLIALIALYWTIQRIIWPSV